MFKKYRQIHFVGIGGVGMSGIAEVLLNLGYRITGSDAKRNDAVERLERLGAKVFTSHLPAHIEGAHVVVYSSAVAVVALFALLIWRGLRIGLRAPDAFGSYLALGLTIMLATQTLVNLGVVTGALPTKGLPLPFISFGGTALLMTMFSAGVLLNISQHASSA